MPTQIVLIVGNITLVILGLFIIWFLSFTIPHAIRNTWIGVKNMWDEPFSWKVPIQWSFMPVAFFLNMWHASQCFFDRSLSITTIRSKR